MIRRFDEEIKRAGSGFEDSNAGTFSPDSLDVGVDAVIPRELLLVF